MQYYFYKISCFWKKMQIEILNKQYELIDSILLENIWRYQRRNQKPLIEEGQTTQWSKEIRTKWQTIIYKILHRKLKNWATRSAQPVESQIEGDAPEMGAY